MSNPYAEGAGVRRRQSANLVGHYRVVAAAVAVAVTAPQSEVLGRWLLVRPSKLVRNARSCLVKGKKLLRSEASVGEG